MNNKYTDDNNDTISIYWQKMDEISLTLVKNNVNATRSMHSYQPYTVTIQRLCFRLLSVWPTNLSKLPTKFSIHLEATKRLPAQVLNEDVYK